MTSGPASQGSADPSIDDEINSSQCRCGAGRFLVKRDQILTTSPRAGQFQYATVQAFRVRALCPSCGRMLEAVWFLNGVPIRAFTEQAALGSPDGLPRPVAPWDTWSRDYLRAMAGRGADTHRNVVTELEDEQLVTAWRAGRAAVDVAVERIASIGVRR